LKRGGRPKKRKEKWEGAQMEIPKSPKGKVPMKVINPRAAGKKDLKSKRKIS